MNKVIKFESSNRRRIAIEEAACAWLAKLESGANEDELKALSAWLHESSEHVSAFFEVCAAWDQLSVLSELSEVFPLEKYRLPVSSGGKSRLWTRRAVAGLVMILTVMAGALTYDFGKQPQADALAGVTIYKTDVGQRSTVTLPDNSEIVLNTNTLIEVRYSGVERRIVLQNGEALFTVTKDSLRPFRVVVGSHVVEAIGTEFTVQKTLNESVEVMVKEGVVGFKSLEERRNDESGAFRPSVGRLQSGISLVAGEVIVTEGPDREVLEKQSLPLQEIESRLSWQHGMLFFQDDPLEEVIREVSRYTTTVIETDMDVGDIRVDGSFPVGDLDALLLAMRENFGLEVVTLRNGNIYLRK